MKHANFSPFPSALCAVSEASVGYNMPMSRSLSTALALILFLAGAGGAESAYGADPPDSPATEALKSGVTRLERAEYSEALREFDSALDLYAGAQRLDDVQNAYMQLFVANRNYANVLMKAMKTWVEKRRTDAGGMMPAALAAFDNWVKQRDALAAATINLVHNSPDWK
jgi:hypothetical protein